MTDLSVLGDSDAGLWHVVCWSWIRATLYIRSVPCQMKITLHYKIGIMSNNRSKLTARQTSALTLLYEQFCSYVIVRYFEEIKWSLSKVVWIPVNHCWTDGFLNKITWNNNWIVVKNGSMNGFTTDHLQVLHCTMGNWVIQLTWWPAHKEAARKVRNTLLVLPAWLLFM